MAPPVPDWVIRVAGSWRSPTAARRPVPGGPQRPGPTGRCRPAGFGRRSKARSGRAAPAGRGGSLRPRLAAISHEPDLICLAGRPSLRCPCRQIEPEADCGPAVEGEASVHPVERVVRRDPHGTARLVPDDQPAAIAAVARPAGPAASTAPGPTGRPSRFQRVHEHDEPRPSPIRTSSRTSSTSSRTPASRPKQPRPIVRPLPRPRTKRPPAPPPASRRRSPRSPPARSTQPGRLVPPGELGGREDQESLFLPAGQPHMAIVGVLDPTAAILRAMLSLPADWQPAASDGSSRPVEPRPPAMGRPPRSPRGVVPRAGASVGAMSGRPQ